VAFEEGRLRSYEGGWAEYARVREERREERREAAAKPSGNGRGARAGPSKNAVRRIGELERDVERAEAALAAVEDELANPAAWSSPSRRERAAKRHDQAKRAVEQAYAAWEQATR
jgi:ATP-binding cassette subfamily F protein 3